jgi:hypothetical protein
MLRGAEGDGKRRHPTCEAGIPESARVTRIPGGFLCMRESPWLFYVRNSLMIGL